MRKELRRSGSRTCGFRIKTGAGVTAIEYGLIASMVALAIIVAVTTLGINLSTMLNRVADNLK